MISFKKKVITAGGLAMLLAFGIIFAVGSQMQNALSASASSEMNTGTMDNNTLGNQSTEGNQTMSSEAIAEDHTTTVVRDSVTILLEGISIPANDYIHLYDTTPYMIMNGHAAAKVPCDANSNPEVQILIGSAPDLNPADFELINELSNPGGLCLYHVDLMSNSSATTGGVNATATIITDVAISNPSNANMTFPATSTVVIGVNEIMPLEGGHEGESHAEGAGEEVS
jgi:hypothetical protein